MSERLAAIGGRLSLGQPGTGDRGFRLVAIVPETPAPPPDGKARLANFPVVIVRDDWLLGVVAVQQAQLFLYELFAESNKPMPSAGPNQWSSKLTPYQRQVLEGLPAAAASEQSVLAARLATFAAFFREAPAIAARSSIAWPGRLEEAVRSYLEKQGSPLPEPATAGP